MFEAEFQCAGKTENGCGSIITVRTQRAIVEGTGTELSCRHCRARYVVTTSGAQMVGDDERYGYPPQAGQYAISEPPPPPPNLRLTE
jgi:hypothetical protein